MTKILDCTLRDGGYYTDWDFESQTVDEYIKAMNALPIDYIEVGYRNNLSNEYLGKFGYSPVSVLKHLREICTKKLVVMLNEKSTKPNDLDCLLGPIIGLVDMIRIAIDPKNFDRAVVLAKAVRAMGFEVGFNCMYMSKWSTEYDGFLNKLSALNDFCDLFCMVDSFGGITPEDVTNIYNEVRANTIVPVGFHGHNNLQLSLINTITAVKLGVDYVDATILGMGRGAGNLNMELLLTYLNAHEGMQVDFNVLGDVISTFTPLMNKYQWGTNLPYMLAGANRIPQKEVMDWVTNRIYSFNSIVRALDNRKNQEADNAKYPIMKNDKKHDSIVVIGGGSTAITHSDAIKDFITKNNSAILFATARHTKVYQDIDCDKYYVLVGTESKRLAANVDINKFNGIILLPPYPRMMGTDVPNFAKSCTYELEKISFVSSYHDSCTTIALQIGSILADGNLFLVGYDGYPGNILSEKEMDLSRENRIIFEAYKHSLDKQLISLTPSLYKELTVKSVYQYL